ncbi:hypothetical protein Taro_046191 [Colocasia esculenta]|uniref:Uncharacterized protein n=1 Tax=Colocasia esculenta TaxID=4460 RepID=A0A843X5A4_COLES|nr:hypothetical protein [Colocasia esculenta]
MHTRQSETTVEGKRRAKARRSRDRGERVVEVEILGAIKGLAEILGAITGFVRIVDNPRREVGYKNPRAVLPFDSTSNLSVGVFPHRGDSVVLQVDAGVWRGELGLSPPLGSHLVKADSVTPVVTVLVRTGDHLFPLPLVEVCWAQA